MKKLLLAAAIVAATATPAFAATTQGTATATVIAPISITHTTGAALRFGSFTVGAGTVVVDASGAALATGGVTLLSGVTPAADGFEVGGQAGRTFAISTTGGSISNGSISMNFVTTPSALTGTLDGTGAATFTVGGTLTVTGAETAGTYTGSYDATVTYN